MGDTGGVAALGFVFIVAGFICTGIVAILFLVGLVKGFGKHSFIVSVITGILLIPLLLFSLPIGYTMLKGKAKRDLEDSKSKSIAWAYMGDDLNSLINNFYMEHPETFTFSNASEAPYSSALMQYLVKQDAFSNSGFTIEEGRLISPFGDRVLLAIDENRDGLINTTNYVRRSPWTDGRYLCVLILHTTKKDAPNSPDWIRQN